MRHTDIWKAVDSLAERHGLSASGLAKRAGLDPTAFNKSKRAGADGSPRWLSTESLMKALDAVGTSLEDFAALAEGRRRDMAAGRTLVGPHRADLQAVYSAKGVAAGQCSTGEQKALLISLILSNARALAADLGRAGDSQPDPRQPPVYRRPFALHSKTRREDPE